MADYTVVRACASALPVLGNGGGGRVHSVFATALNLQAGEGLLTLLSAGRGLSPGGLLLQERVDFTRLGLTRGERAVWCGGRLGLPLRNREIELAGAEVVDLTMPKAFAPAACRHRNILCLAGEIPAREEAGQGLAPLLCLVWPACPYEMPQNHYTRHLLPVARVLAQCLGRRQAQALEALAGRFAGCGPGLTPSSDDFLCGVMAALHAQAAAGLVGAGYAAEAAGALARGACPKTGAISAGFLRHAASGRFDEDMLALAAAFFSPASPELLRRAAGALMEHGSSSGCDTLTGFCFGLLPGTDETI